MSLRVNSMASSTQLSNRPNPLLTPNRLVLVGLKVVYFMIYLSLAMAGYRRINQTLFSKESFILSVFILEVRTIPFNV